MCNYETHDHITPVLKQLHWLKVGERIRYIVLILAHKSFYETAHQYLSALVTRKDHLKNTRSSTGHYLLCTPPLSKDFSNTFPGRSFIFSTPREWNSLDENIRKSDFNMFKKVLKQNYLSNVMNADSLRIYLCLCCWELVIYAIVYGHLLSIAKFV